MNIPAAKIKSRISQAWNHKGLRKYSENTFWSIAARSFNQIIAFFVTAYVIRYLGPENYGQLSYAVSFIGIFSFIAYLGLDSILYRNLIERPDKHDVYLGTALRIRLWAAIGASVVAILTAFLMVEERGISFILICILSVTYIAQSWNVIATEFQSHVKHKIPSIISIFVATFLSIGKLAIIYFDKGIIYFAVLLAIEPMLYSIAYVYIREKMYSSINEWRFEWGVAKSMLRDAWPLILTTSFVLIYSRIDQVILKHLIDTRAVGIYDSAIKIAEAWYTIPAIIVSTLFPSLINARKTEFSRYKNRLLWISLFLMGLSAFVAIIIMIAAPWIMRILYGSEYISGVSVLRIYSWSGVWIALSYVAHHYLVAENKIKILFLTSFAAMVCNVVLNIYLIPKLGMDGAAWATFISYIILALPILHLIKKKGFNENDRPTGVLDDEFPMS